MGLANKITIARILFVPLFMVFLLAAPQPMGAYIAAAIFTIAAITDSIDGYVARSQSQITVFGQLMDPLADKLLVSAALISLVQLGLLSAWVAVLIIAREFAVSGLRLLALTENKVISASLWGRIKTISQIVAIIAIMINMPISFGGMTLGLWFMAIAVVLTIISGADYFLKSWRVLNGGAQLK
ncbi:MAG: CDP-diacylglycerol--glycerol-3-phosphate 3-phosphatidyltransferase [Candidatus Aquicultor primus]|uniref:CDP-diacylglycerol--glycerol-3-phosphate 3-phosphatidyltransferase n=1 Tax=Candidatus Aquicultor primus TaxID=1797195 RepID=A0A1F2UFI9_9ACTN|nr:MAG: CDP-diacylglycerol--glycerol-3-phosphate 3-phosphatidyltransferase [Candidatus Aquicultor primus]